MCPPNYNDFKVSINAEQVSRNNEATRRGRPKVMIDSERLIFLKECGFKIKDIAAFFGCCAGTIERCFQEYSIPRRRDVYSAISDADLDEKVLSIVSFFSQMRTEVCG